MCVSVFIMILNVVCYAVPFAFTRTPITIIMLLGFGFGIPACGYFGAKERSKTLIGAFWCCNGCNLALLILLLIATSILLAIFAVALQFLPAYADCCDQFRACDWNATATGTGADGCTSCAVNATDAPIVYMVGSDMCAPEGGGPAPPSAFAYLAATAQGTDVADFDDASASGSGGEGQTAICLGRAECRVIDYIKDWRVTRPVVGIFLGLFIVLMIPTVRHPRCPHQATVGLKSLFSDRDDLSW
eukprot:COSAG03_NODE_160_length_11366_cov_10.057518_13_plen_245_part_00